MPSALNPVVITLTNNGPGYINGGSGTQMTTINLYDLFYREGVWRSAIFRDINTNQTTDALPFASPAIAKYEGNPMRGHILKVQIESNRPDASILRSVSVGFTASEVSFN